MDTASVSEGLQAIDSSIRIRCKSSPRSVLSPHQIPDTVLSTGRWAEMGLDKGDSESGPDLRNAFLTMYTMNYIMLYKVSTEKGI